MMPETAEQTTSKRGTRRAWRGVGALLLLLVSLTGVGIFVSLRSAEREPRYQGRGLSSWLADLDFSKPAPVRAAAQSAVLQIGTNALPTLRQWMLAKEEGMRWHIAARLSIWSGRRWNWFPPDRREIATRGYEALGVLAEPAVPELIVLLRDEASRDQAACALAGIGSPSVSPLISCLSSDDREVQRLAATALGAIAAQPDLSVPALLARLAQTNDSYAIRSLGEFGDAAMAALPQLESALTNSDSGWYDPAYALAQVGEVGLLPLIRGLLSTNSSVRRASSAGLFWQDFPPKTQVTVGKSKLSWFMERSCIFNAQSLALANRFYSVGEAATFLPLVAPHLQSTNAQVREAAVAVTNRLAQLRPYKKMPMTRPRLPSVSTDE